MYMPPDVLSDLKREKVQFQNKNYIDGQGILMKRIQRQKIAKIGNRDESQDAESKKYYHNIQNNGGEDKSTYQNESDTSSPNPKHHQSQPFFGKRNQTVGIPSSKKITESGIVGQPTDTVSNGAASTLTKQISNKLKSVAGITNAKTNASQSTFDLKRRAREKQYEKIKEYAIQFNVDEAMIYALLSEYKSLQKIKIDDELPGHHAQTKPDTKSTTVGKTRKPKVALGLGNMNQNSIDQELLIVEAPSDMGAAQNATADDASSGASQLITMKAYMHFSVFKRLLHADVLTRILQAFGKTSLIIQ